MEGTLASLVRLCAILSATRSDVQMPASMGATLAATEAYVANQREKDDAVNGLAGGCAAGFLLGLRSTWILDA